MSLSKNCIVYENIYQRSEAWFKLRAGRLTASNFKRLLTPTGNPSPERTRKGALGENSSLICAAPSCGPMKSSGKATTTRTREKNWNRKPGTNSEPSRE